MSVVYELLLCEETRWAHYKPTIHSEDPWVVTFDDFLTDAVFFFFQLKTIF